MPRNLTIATTIVLLACLATLVPASTLDPNLVGWWRFDDGSGSAAIDSSGNERHGVLVDGPQWVTGVNKGALSFDGGGNHVAVPDYDGVLGSQGRTSAAWIRVAKTSASIVTWGPAGAGTKWVMRTHNGPASLRVECGQSYIYGVTDLADGEWHHVAAALEDDGSPDVDEIKLYVDGIVDETGAFRSRLVNTSNGGGFGIAYDLNNTGRAYEGLLDDVRVYDRALGQEEIESLMEAPAEVATQAVSPEPQNGSLLDDTWAVLRWTAGDLSTSHNVFIGLTFSDVNEATPDDVDVFIGKYEDTNLLLGTTNNPFPEGLLSNQIYYWRVDEISEEYPAGLKGNVWSFLVPGAGAWNPLPADDAKLVDPNSDLLWTAGLKAIMYKVYFDEDANSVASAAAAQNLLAETSFDPGSLEWGKTYYWRVDQFNGTTWIEGDVWNFTVTSLGGGLKGEYFNNMALVGDPVLTRIDPGVDFDLGEGSPEPNVVNVDAFSVRWRGEIEPVFTEAYTFYTRTNDGSRLWIDEKLVVDKWAWVNRVVDTRSEPIELIAGQRYAIQMEWFNEDGDAEAHLLWESARQPNSIVPAAALSLPLRAGVPKPTANATEVTQTPVLTWAPGEYAAEHDVYFGQDEEIVAAATTETETIYRGRMALDEISFDPGPLEWGKTYYWKVDEVNDVRPESPWTGRVWSFTTADFIVVDDFESYTDDMDAEEAVFQTWIDGWINDTGSLVGYVEAPFTEQTILHGGVQSMPLGYQNELAPYYSEAERSWATPQDWTTNGVDTLTLYFRGDSTNQADTLYVTLEDGTGRTGTVTHPDPSALLETNWQLWAIPLSTFSTASVNVTDIKKMVIGVGNRHQPTPGGPGQLYFDDIRVTGP